jgi:hypothetical protein
MVKLNIELKLTYEQTVQLIVLVATIVGGALYYL